MLKLTLTAMGELVKVLTNTVPAVSATAILKLGDTVVDLVTLAVAVTVKLAIV